MGFAFWREHTPKARSKEKRILPLNLWEYPLMVLFVNILVFYFTTTFLPLMMTMPL